MKTRTSFAIAITVSALMLLSSFPHFGANAVSSQHSSNVVVNFNGGALPGNYAGIISDAGGEGIKAIPEIGGVDAKASTTSSDTFLSNLRGNNQVFEAGFDPIRKPINPPTINTGQDVFPNPL